MRKILASLLIMSFNAYAAAPTAINSETAATKTYAQDVKLPNNQATKLAGLDTRVETGNTNLLANPSFEAATASTSWTLTNATAAESLVDFTDGKKGLTVTPTVSGGGIKQTSTLYASKIIGGQGIASISVKTTGTDVYVCPLMNGARPSDTTKYCVNVTPTSSSIVFKRPTIPFILDGTSNGIEIFSTGTSVFTVDNAFAGESAPFQGVSGARLVGTVTVTGCASGWSVANTAFSAYGTQTGCSYAVTGQLQAPGTNIPGFTVASLPAGDYRVEYSGLMTSPSGQDSYVQFYDGTNASKEATGLGGGSSSVDAGTSVGTFSYSTSQTNVTFQTRGKVASGTTTIFGTNAIPGTFKLYYFPPESKIYSQASQNTGWEPCAFSTLAWNGLGTVNANGLFCKRDQDTLRIKGRFDCGTTAAAEARIPLPNNWGTITTKSTLTGNSSGGYILRAAASSGIYMNTIMQASASYLTISNSLLSAANSPTTPVNGSGVLNTGDTVIVPEISIPINEWKDYGVIVGSFAGIEKCASDLECTDTFSAQVSATGVVSNENIDWINGNCSIAANVFTCPYLSNTLKDGTSALTSPLNCTFTATTGVTASPIPGIVSSSTTQFQYQTTNDAGTLNSSAFSVKCSKGANDFKPKTAKVATSIDVPTMPGTSTVKLFDINFGGSCVGDTGSGSVCSTGNCAICKQNGYSGSLTVSFVSTGVYRINGVDGSKTICNGTGYASGLTTVYSSNNSANSSYYQFTMLTAAGSGANSDNVSLRCSVRQ